MMSRSAIVFVLLVIKASLLPGQSPSPAFINCASERGLSFHHSSPQSPLRHIHLTMGSGAGVVDFDADGWPDIYLVQGGEWTGQTVASSPSSDHLFRNRFGEFQDVSECNQTDFHCYGMGIAVGDVNNDGFADVYVSRFGPDVLLLNNGDGTFLRSPWPLPESTAAYSASCTWTDVNSDGNIDLFLTRYVDVSESDYPVCTDESSGLPIACAPRDLRGLHDVVLLNHGDGVFVDVSEQSGLHTVEPAQGLGVVAADFDEDGDVDVFVANDSVPNHLWTNDGRGHFIESALFSGVAVNRDGLREAGMGVVAGDANGDGRPEIVVTNFQAETNTFYRNEGAGFFLDASDEIGIGAPSRSRLTFGVNFLDYDGDSDLDLFFANGHIHDQLDALQRQIPYRQPAQLLGFDGGRFQDISGQAGAIFQEPVLGRSSATFDFNLDGRTDILVTNLNDSPLLIENQTKRHGNAFRVQLVARSGNRMALGAVVKAIPVDSVALWRFVVGSDSYLSSSDPVVVFGVGPASKSAVEVSWQNGNAGKWANIECEGTVVLVEARHQVYAIPR